MTLSRRCWPGLSEVSVTKITELGSGENSLLSSEATVIPSLVSAFSVMPGKTHLCVAIKSNRVKSVRNDIEHLHCALRTVQITNESTFKSTCIYIWIKKSGASQEALVEKNPPTNAGDAGDATPRGVRKIPWRRKWQPTPVFLPGKSHGKRSLAGCVHGAAKSPTWPSTHTQRNQRRHTWILCNMWDLLGDGQCSFYFRHIYFF